MRNIVECFSFVYYSPNVTKAENLYAPYRHDNGGDILSICRISLFLNTVSHFFDVVDYIL